MYKRHYIGSRASLRALALGLAVLATGTSASATPQTTFILQAGNAGPIFSEGTVTDGFASASAFAVGDKLPVDVDLSVEGRGENDGFLTSASAQISIGVIVDGPFTSSGVPVDIGGRYLIDTTGLGAAGVRVGVGVAATDPFGGTFLYGDGCFLINCQSGFGPSFLMRSFLGSGAKLIPGIEYAFALQASGNVIADSFSLKGGSYSASIDPSIFIDNSSGLYSDYSLEIAAIPTDVVAVPEPSSWILMLGGFGVLGALLRRRLSTAEAHLKPIGRCAS